MAKQDLVNDLNQLIHSGRSGFPTAPGVMLVHGCRDGLITEANKVDVIKVVTSLLIWDVETEASTMLFDVRPTITVDITALRTQIRHHLDVMIKILPYLTQQSDRPPSDFFIKIRGIKRVVSFDPFNVMRMVVKNEHKGSDAVTWSEVVDYVTADGA